jgi:proline iminopeptidase
MTMALSTPRHILLVLTLVLLSCQIQSLSGFVTVSSTSPRSPLLLHQSSSKYNEGELTVTRPDGQDYKLAYRIARPVSLSSRQAAPIVVLHGGPSVPSDYLYPLEQAVGYRSIVFYDQLGCGKSDEPKDLNCYSIDLALDDLEALLKKIGVRRFHLYGQSFGGILAFEYLKRQAERNQDDGCLSVILSSTPTNVAQVEEEASRLVAKLTEQHESDDDDVVPLEQRFRLAHQCRTTPEKSQPLVDAYAHAGTVWRGTTAISDYEATPPFEGATRMKSCMVMRGEHDFVTQDCIEGWKDAFNHKFVRFKVLEGCSHHGLLENGPLYGEVVDSFFAEFD